MLTDRKPWAATLLSLFAPGLGHLYAGRPRQAILWAIAPTIGAITAVTIALGWIRGAAAILLLVLLPIGVRVVPAITAWKAAKTAAAPFVLAWYNRWYVYLGFWALAVVLSAYVVYPGLRRHYQAFRIPSDAMQPTLAAGDYLFVRKGFTPVEPGVAQIVVFESPEESGILAIKRIVGLPGDTVAMRAGVLYRNGLAVSEPFVPHENTSKQESLEYRNRMRAWQQQYLVDSAPASYDPDLNQWGPLAVPADSFLVLGDNRELSYDGRYYGWVARDRLVGTPTILYFSYDPRSPNVLKPLTAARWDRVGRSLLP